MSKGDEVKHYTGRGNHSVTQLEQLVEHYMEQEYQKQLKVQIMLTSLKTLLDQPFDGDWDAQARFIQVTLAKVQS